MAVFSKSIEINKILNTLGRTDHRHRAVIEGHLNANFELKGEQGLTRKYDSIGSGSAWNSALALKVELEKAAGHGAAASAPETDGRTLNGVHPYPTPDAGVFATMSPEDRLRAHSRATMPAGFSWDGR